MQGLSDFQSALGAFLTSSPAAPPDPELMRQLCPGGATPPDRLAVYKNNVHTRLIEALRDTFPVVTRLVGEEFFRFAAREYIQEDLPRCGVLLEYGKFFPQFLAAFEPAESVPYLADVARVEYLYLEAYLAPDEPPLTLADAEVAWKRPLEELEVALHASARLMTSAHPVSRIWEINRHPDPVRRTRIPATGEYLLIVRPQSVIDVRRLSPGAYAMLLALEAGFSLATAIDFAHNAERNFDPLRQLVALVSGGAFAAAGRTRG